MKLHKIIVCLLTIGCITTQVYTAPDRIIPYNATLHQQDVEALILEMNGTHPNSTQEHSSEDNQWLELINSNDNTVICNVYVHDSKVIGFISYRTSLSLLDHEPKAHILYFYSAHSAQNQDIDTALVKHMLQDCTARSLRLITIYTKQQGIINYFCNEFGFNIEPYNEKPVCYTVFKTLRP
jgi:GNAT superfamily N-acetyltransferase